MIVPYNVDVPMERLPIANWAVIAGTSIVSVGAWANPENAESWMLWRGDAFEATQLPTHQLLHGGPLHLIGNMMMLFVFGNAVNARLGHIAFVLAYALSGVCAGLLWLATDGGEASLGASGAIMGVIGMFLVYYPRNDVSVFIWVYEAFTFQVSAYWIILLYVGLDLFAFSRQAEDGVAHAAHLGGAGAGFAIASGLVLSGLIKPGAGEHSIFQAIREGGKKNREERWVERPLSREPVGRLPPELRGGRSGSPGAGKGGSQGSQPPKAPPGGWR